MTLVKVITPLSIVLIYVPVVVIMHVYIGIVRVTIFVRFVDWQDLTIVLIVVPSCVHVKVVLYIRKRRISVMAAEK